MNEEAIGRAVDKLNTISEAVETMGILAGDSVADAAKALTSLIGALDFVRITHETQRGRQMCIDNALPSHDLAEVWQEFAYRNGLEVESLTPQQKQAAWMQKLTDDIESARSKDGFIGGGRNG